MFHMAISSLEPLPLSTFVSALDFVIDNKGIYAGDHDAINFNNAGSSDSVISHLRCLSSRSGGLLETQVINIDTSAVSPKENATGEHDGIPLDTQTGYENKNCHTPPREVIDGVRDSVDYDVAIDKAVEKLPQSVQYVEFLHATAKDYIRNNQDTMLVGQIQSPFVGFRGNDFLFTSCASCESWVVPIKRDLLHYAKMAEMRLLQMAERNDMVLHGTAEHQFHVKPDKYMLATLSDVVSNRGTHDLAWWLQLREETFFKRIEQERGVDIEEYVMLILAIAGNLKILVQELLSSETLQSLVRYDLARELRSPTYVAAVGPSLVPAEHQDRVGMIKILVSSGCSVEKRTKLPARDLSHEGSFKAFDVYVTPLEAVLTQSTVREDPDETTLRVAECLLEQGASPNIQLLINYGEKTLLSYSVQHLSVGVVRLLLRYGADTNPHTPGLKPAHHAAIRQDKAIMDAIREFGGSLIPNLAAGTHPDPDLGATETAIVGIGFCGIIIGFAHAQASFSLVRK